MGANFTACLSQADFSLNKLLQHDELESQVNYGNNNGESNNCVNILVKELNSSFPNSLRFWGKILGHQVMIMISK